MSRLARLTVVVIAIALASTLSVSAQEPIRLTFWNYWDGKNGEAIQALVEQFNAGHPDIQVENVFFGWGELLPRLQAAAVGGESPR